MYPYLTYQEFVDSCGLTEAGWDLSYDFGIWMQRDYGVFWGAWGRTEEGLNLVEDLSI